MARLDFEDVVARYDKRLFNVMYGLTGNYHDALDLTEEAFIKAMKAYPRFRGESDPFTWLYRIALNVLKKRHRKNARRAELWREHQESNPSPSSETRTAEHAVIEEERAQLVRQAIAQLPAAFREAITFRYIDEMSYEEISIAAGCSIGTVKSRISRGKALLANLLGDKV
ncbi:MAG: sigma-70 family RNA polymerase sigma factor [Candidatus Eisenbacteria sp.]|nr:sigma-70 family RNA polymerase sigma factor [Candidatus Eisenbacteria bacterium]